MRKATALLALCVLHADIYGFPRNGVLRRLWRIDLRNLIKEPEMQASPSHKVFGIRFSPDNKSIAVVVESYLPKGTRISKHHLLVLGVEHPENEVRQFEIQRGINDDETFSARWSSFAWTWAGDAILAGGEVIRLAPKACAVSEGDEHIGSRLEIGEIYGAEAKIVRFLILDAACHTEAKWNFSHYWTLMDVSLDRKLICVVQHSPQLSKNNAALANAAAEGRAKDVLIVNPLSGEVIQRWPTTPMANGPLRFADSGKAICGGQLAEHAGSIPVRCWDVDTGRVIKETTQINAGAPISVAILGTRVIASDYRYVRALFADNDHAELRRRVIWDFRSGKELASWRPLEQTIDIEERNRAQREPYKFAISQDGRYVAEGGDGILELNEIVP